MVGMKREWPVLEDVLRSALARSPMESSVPARSRGEAAAEAACFWGRTGTRQGSVTTGRSRQRSCWRQCQALVSDGLSVGGSIRTRGSDSV